MFIQLDVGGLRKIKTFNGAVAIVYINNPVRKYAIIHSHRGFGLPGGGFELGDQSTEDIIKREIKEELGLEEKDYYLRKTNLVEEFTYDDNKGERSGKTTKRAVYLAEIFTVFFNPIDPKVIRIELYSEDKIREKLTWPNALDIFNKGINLI